MNNLPKNERKLPCRLLSQWSAWLSLLCIACCSGLHGQSASRVLDTTTIFPSADTYVRSTGSDAGLNFSGDSVIKARYSTSSAYHELGLLKYDLTSFADLRYLVIDSVKLEMTLVYEQVSGAFATIIGIPDGADGWNAGTVTWNAGRPDTTQTLARVGLPQIASQVASSAGIPVSFDLTARFMDELHNGNQTLSLAVFTEKNAGANTYFLSSESALAGARPKLVVYAHREAVSSGVRNLNVVYFLPTDADTVAAYQERLNGILYQAQNFYRKWMQHWGYGDRSFGLRRDSLGRVKIVIVHGAHEKTYYPYDGGGGKARAEIEAYFATHPEDKQSTHTLVMFPPNIDSTGKEDVPFYGIGGGWCFALDNPDIDTNYTGTSNYIGGMIHELGHGLNLPHVRQKVSELANPDLGTSLMGTGNYTYRKNPTFLTESSCAILNNCEVFAAGTPPADLYQETNASLVRLHGSYSDGNIIVNGRFASTKPVNNVLVYNDPDGGDNYDRESWVAAPVGSDSFSVVMPVSELHKKDGNYKLVVSLLCSNGATKEFNFNYYFENNLPVIDINVDNYIDTVGTKVYLVPTDDTYGIYADRTNTHGEDSLIQVRYSLSGSQTYNKIGYLKFDLDQLHLPAGAVIKNILLQAKLQYHQVSSAYKINVLQMADDQDGWDESTLTWNNRPDTLATIASAPNQAVGSYLSWVVTGAALADLDTGNHILSLALYTELNSAANTWFYSKESADPLDHPKLMVVYTLPETEETAQALPVHQLKLSASRSSKQVVLKWTADLGSGAKAFLVQRSTDGNVYTTIGEVKAGATFSSRSLTPSDPYSFAYNEPEAGTKYYRIAAMDGDAVQTYAYSNISVLHVTADLSALSVKLYPNPVRASSAVKLNFLNTTGLENARVNMADISGRVVFSRSYAVRTGLNTLQLDLSGRSGGSRFTPGVYFVLVQGDSGAAVVKPLKLLIE